MLCPMTRKTTLPTASLFALALLGACAGSSTEPLPDGAPQQDIAGPQGVQLAIYDVRDLVQGEATEQLGRELAAACHVQVEAGPSEAGGMLMIRGTPVEHAAVAEHLDRLRRAHAAR